MVEQQTIINNTENIKVVYNKNDFSFNVETPNKVWCQKKDFKPYVDISYNDEIHRLYFENAESITHKSFETGIGRGIKCLLSNFKIGKEEIELCFEISIWIDNIYEDIHFELIPINEVQGIIEKIVWPGPFDFKKKEKNNYTVIPMMLGCIIPNNWAKEVHPMENGRYYTRGAYMPWWGQVEDNNGYIAIAETPWDGGYELVHPAGGETNIASVWYPSLGEIGYNRKIKYSFMDECDYNRLCKVYKKYVKQQKGIVTLEEKAIQNPNINQLIGSPVIHSFIYNHTEPSSDIYDREHPENNDVLVSFNERVNQLKELKEKGVEKAYLHLDGWGKRGYDNLHPDVFPPCKQAGGWQGMKYISDTCKELNYIFAIHDQYRDYYLDAETYNKEHAIHNSDNNITVEAEWAGGNQTFLCTQLAPYYVKRNFETQKKNGIELNGAYLDVFSVVTLDECYHQEHRMSRKQCMEKRRECFNYVSSEKILISSEECVDWALPNMDLVHHSPMALTVPLDGWDYTGDAIGIPVPLYTLVYHECLVVPWALKKGGWGLPTSQDGFLYALLNGGTGYLDIEADTAQIEKNKIVCKLHEKIAKKEMVRHEFIDGSLTKQRSVFSDGTMVEVDFENDTYSIGEK
ncbi:DUF5696 domain-containing protein [Vallitalea guaymasensis]|uniref:Uncharacterized protein n=1 Tax=Vallitalea guaymasensis TaxID=1185412 RepID=A0A8J8M7Q1_9FIRM|nr:DUF5696 domain-containing protein [Vallitalea guaymasensis]QUH27660.1 hypothetical protein HYG85_01510 [Vallitalea guaymasensis]